MGVWALRYYLSLSQIISIAFQELPKTESHANTKPLRWGQIDENLNQLKQDDPALIEAVRDRLILPTNEPFKWGSTKRTGWYNRNALIKECVGDSQSS